jgi:hypothetical protein
MPGAVIRRKFKTLKNMITLFIAASELKRIKQLIAKNYNVIYEMHTASFCSLCVEIEELPFELSPQEMIENLYQLIYKSGQYKKIEPGTGQFVCIIGRPFNTAEAIFIGKL